MPACCGPPCRNVSNATSFPPGTHDPWFFEDGPDTDYARTTGVERSPKAYPLLALSVPGHQQSVLSAVARAVQDYRPARLFGHRVQRVWTPERGCALLALSFRLGSRHDPASVSLTSEPRQPLSRPISAVFILGVLSNLAGNGRRTWTHFTSHQPVRARKRREHLIQLARRIVSSRALRHAHMLADAGRAKPCAALKRGCRSTRPLCPGLSPGRGRRAMSAFL